MDTSTQGPGYRSFLEVGVRVTLRYRIDRASTPGGVGHTDALGYITAVDPDSVTVLTRRGEVRVERALVTASRTVPPPPEPVRVRRAL
ncbi:acetyltransferase [Dermabacteraceae bacterium TAE3-ERU5]|nr:acetyltransferase [Dermabacteraceae bacterium TAE3-ERU5]